MLERDSTASLLPVSGIIIQRSRIEEDEGTQKMEPKAVMHGKRGASPRMALATNARTPATRIKSVTREEIDRFWKRKRMVEEEHLLAAQKAAARVRARAITEDQYKQFEESLKEIINNSDDENRKEEEDACSHNKEVRVGIKDWWTKSKYAYLNQPVVKSMEEDATPKRATSTYVPHKINFFCYSTAPAQPSTIFSVGVY